MSRLIYFIFILQLCACETLFPDFAALNAASCHNGGTQCAPGYACNQTNRQCEPTASGVPNTPVLRGVTPAIASNRGGGQLQFAGEFFQDGATIRIGDAPDSAATLASSRLLKSKAPATPRSFGTFPVVIQNPDGQQVSRSDLFSYYQEQPFQTRPPSCLIDGQPVSVSTGDWNRDGKPDIAVVDTTTSSVSVFLGDGLGKLDGTAKFAVGTTPLAAVAADLNRDGKLDLVTVSSVAKGVSVLLGDGAGGFGTATNFLSTGQSPTAVGIGDVNGV